MIATGTAKPEMACICGERAPVGTERCSCGGQMYLVGTNPWAKPGASA